MTYGTFVKVPLLSVSREREGGREHLAVNWLFANGKKSLD